MTLVLAAPAAAAKPEKQSEIYNSAPAYLYSCSDVFPGNPAFDFDVWSFEHWTTEATWWLKPDGDPISGVAHHSGTKSVYRVDKPDLVLSGPFRYTWHMDFINWDPVKYYEYSTGVFWNLHLAGRGTVFHEAGQWSTLLEWPEDWDWPYFLDIYKTTGVARFDGEAVCEALAG